MDLAALAAPFPRAHVHWRVQGKPFARNGKHSAMALAYIDARDVMDRLDAVCGPDGWQSEIVETASGRVLCRLGIRTDAGWVWKTDGAGGTQVEAEKGGISDSLKRAAVAWGVGRYLYRMESPWVGCEVNEKTGGWKRWTEDPWSKVKNAPPEPRRAPSAPPPQLPAAEPAEPVEEPENERDEMLAAFAGCVTLQQVKATWAMIEPVARRMPPDLQAQVVAAKDAAKKRAHDAPAGQAPAPTQEARESAHAYQ